MFQSFDATFQLCIGDFTLNSVERQPAACSYFLRLTCAVAGAVQGFSGQGCFG